jgi:hypothetical protein
VTGVPGPRATQPPEIDHPEIAAALQEVADLDERPLEEHQARLGRAHEVLDRVLHPDVLHPDVLHPDPDAR